LPRRIGENPGASYKQLCNLLILLKKTVVDFGPYDLHNITSMREETMSKELVVEKNIYERYFDLDATAEEIEEYTDKLDQILFDADYELFTPKFRSICNEIFDMCEELGDMMYELRLLLEIK
jgi:hypothetical protein